MYLIAVHRLSWLKFLEGKDNMLPLIVFYLLLLLLFLVKGQHFLHFLWRKIEQKFQVISTLTASYKLSLIFACYLLILLYLIQLFCKILGADLPFWPTLRKVLSSSSEICFYYLIYILIDAVHAVKLEQISHRPEKATYAGVFNNPSFLNYAAIAVKILVFVVGAISILSLWVYNINGLLASLSLGGLAISLAAKDTISNLFASLALMLDRPFELGDWIKIGEHEGIVTKVGIRSTRIKALDETIFTLPNSLVAQSAINTAGQRTRRRLELTFSFTYASQLPEIKEFCRRYDAYLAENYAKFGKHKVYLSQLADSALIITADFYAEREYDVMVRTRAEALYKAMSLADKLHLDFAFPSVSVYEMKN